MSDYYTDQHYYSPPLHSPVGGVEESVYWCENELEYYRGPEEQPVLRVVRRRNTANKKERRRTQSINNAFADLREAIPNVPKDTKLSKIKTLRLATSYIGYLMGVLEREDCCADEGFKADLGPPRRPSSSSLLQVVDGEEGRKLKGRTGWPQHVWALELNHDSRTPPDLTLH